MKTKNCMLTLLIVFFLGFSCYAQELIEKSFFDSNSKLGSDVIIKKSTIKVEGTKSYKIFEIESPGNGNYYMNAWVSGAELEKFGSGKFVEYELVVNDEKQIEKFRPAKSNWQNAEYNDSKTKEKKTVKLKKGINQIIFSCYAPLIPDIDFITLSLDETKSEISDTKYNEFVEKIKSDMVGRMSNPIDITDSLRKLKNGIVLPNPEGNFNHHLGATFMYTYYTTASFTSGQQIFITTNANNFQHVLELFSASDPQNAAWTVISNSNSLAAINVTIPISGIYYIKVRSWSQSQQGLVNINVNGQYYYTNCTASGYSGFRHSLSPGTYNYYTCKISGDTRIWLEDNIGFPGRIVAYNDDYSGSGDFSWAYASRINKNFSINIEGMQFSSYSSNTPTGTCDYYIDVNPLSTETYYTGIWPFRKKHTRTPILDLFPNLKADDAMQSAPASEVYNCISWSGGITNYWEWPLSLFSIYFDYGGSKKSFDNFYGSPGRYGGCMTYSATGATSSNSVVDLWYNPNSYGIGQGEYTHGSVTKPGNNMPHGYDWESKPGNGERIFHQRSSLNSVAIGGYGTVTDYYKPTSLKTALLLDESIALGYSVIENVIFTDQEKDIISNSIKLITNNVKEQFENKYNLWKTTWVKPELAKQSNPRMYAQSDEYKDLMVFCISQGKAIWPFIFDKFSQGDFFTINALEDLTLAQNQSVLGKVKKESNLKSMNESGAVIVRSPQTIAMKYIKELLKSSNPDKSNKDNGIIYSNSFKFNVFPNPANTTSVVSFVLDTDSKISANIVDLNGRVLSVIIDEQIVNAGHYSYNLRLPTEFRGPCLIKLIIDGTVNVQKIIVQ